MAGRAMTCQGTCREPSASPHFLLGSLGRSQAPWWWHFPFPGAVHVLWEERAGFQGWGDGCALAPMDLEQPCASMGVTDL